MMNVAAPKLHSRLKMATLFKMADVIDFSTDFRLFLPDLRSKTNVCINENLSRSEAYTGECIDVWLVAKCRSGSDENEDLTVWKNRLSSLCADVSVKPVGNETDDSDFQSHTFFIDDMPEPSESYTKTFTSCDVIPNVNDYFTSTVIAEYEPPSPLLLTRTQVRKSINTRSRKSQLANESGMSTWPRRRRDRSISDKENNSENDGDVKLHYGPLHQSSVIKNDTVFQSQPTLIEDTLVFQMTITLDCVSTGSNQVTLTAWIWTSEYDRMEYLACRPPVSESATEIRNGDKLIANSVSMVVTVKQPPDVTCRQYSVGGNHFLTMKVFNNLKLAITVTGSRVLYAFTDNTSHDKPDELVSLIGDENTLFPVTLLPWEETNFTFIINMANFQLWEEEIRLLGLLPWRYSDDQTTPVYSYYRLPSLVTSQAAFVFSASGYQKIDTGQTFTVNYKIHNQLHDFLSIKMNWRPDKALNDGKVVTEEERGQIMSVINNVICQEPSVHLGACRMGASLTYSVAFQILKPGMYELGKHMRLSLHYGVNPPNLETRRPSTTSLGAQLKNAILRPNIFNRSSSIDEGDQRSPKLRLASSHNTPTPSRSPSSHQLLPNSGSQRDLLTVTPQQIVKLSYKVIAV